MKDKILIQYLRKSKLGRFYLSEYVNSFLKSILNTNSDSNFNIYIRGACWSTKNSTAKDLVEKVFDGLLYNNFNIYLCNHYPRFSSKETHSALISMFGTKNIQIKRSGSKCLDHAKEFLITQNKKPIFYLVGSSNFSKNTYLTKDRGVDQSDIAFLFSNNKTNGLLNIIEPSDIESGFYSNWVSLQTQNNNNEKDRLDNSFALYLKEKNESIFSSIFLENKIFLMRTYLIH